MAVSLTPLYVETTYHVEIFVTLAALGVFVALLSIFKGWKIATQISVALFILGPPTWFFYEYFYFFPAHGNDLAGWDKLKSAQDVTSKLWAAGSAILGTLYSKKFP